LDDFAECYIAGADPNNPYISPLFADLEKIPAVFIQGGDMEVLLGDFLTFADRCKKASVPCELDIWEGCFHVFQILIGIPFIGKRIKEVKGAFNNIKKFVNTL